MDTKIFNKTKFLTIGVTMGVALTSLAACSPGRAEPENTVEKVEGAGYESPEKAVEAYVNFLQEQNLKGAMSAFAVESYADHYDMAENYEYVRSFMAYTANGGQMTPGLYFDSDMTRDLNIESRRAYVFKGIQNQLMQIIEENTDETEIVENIYRQISFEDDKVTTEEVMDFLSTDPELDTIVIGEFLSEEDFDLPDFRMIDNAMEAKERSWGSDVEEVMVELNIAGEDYTLFMLCVCYDDKWYVAEFNNPIGQSYGVSYSSMGLVQKEFHR